MAILALFWPILGHRKNSSTQKFIKIAQSVAQLSLNKKVPDIEKAEVIRTPLKWPICAADWPILADFGQNGHFWPFESPITFEIKVRSF